MSLPADAPTASSHLVLDDRETPFVAWDRRLRAGAAAAGARLALAGA